MSPLAAELMLDVRARLGEGPRWDPAGGLLEWVDMSAGTWHRYDPVRGAQPARRLGGRLSSILPRRRGGQVAAVDGALLLLDAAGAVERSIPLIPPGGDLVLNDARCDAAGRCWIGTASRASHAAAALLRVEPDGGVHVARAGVTMSNGLDWSPDGRILYHVDSGTRQLSAADCDPVTGALGEPRTLIELTSDDGIPDGLAVDADGAIWLAVWGAGELRRYDAVGRPIGTVRVPATQVTSCAFGGARLDLLWITTAREGLTPTQLSTQPHAGGLFAAAAGVRGLPAQAFAG